MESLSGVVERITYINEESGFSVIKIRCKGFSELVSVVGNMAAVNVGSVVSLKGQWNHDSKYGRQFNVHSYSETIPASAAGIEKYLGSGLIKGIGPVNAKRIVRRFKEDTIRVIEEEPEKLTEVEGIGQKRLEMIQKAWQEHKEIKNIMLFLQEYGVSAAYAVKIYKAYGNESVRVVKENPFRLADDIWGIGFKTADRIAGKMGFERESYPRCRAGLIYVLNQMSNEGHCYLRRDQLIKEAENLLEISPETISKTIDRMLAEDSLILDEEDALYLPSLYFSEEGTARRIKEILSHKSKYNPERVDEIVAQVEKENNIVYDRAQVEAIRAAAASKFMVLTGGPGTGKTTTTLAIIKVFEKMWARILLAAPTGRAAKRLSEAAGMEAKTIHRLLEFKPPHGYQKNAGNPLACDVLIIDETSMVDIVLMYNLLRAVPDSAVVILVGDVDQLPSVGPGSVLKDLIDSGKVKVVRLERIFRQAQGSMIVTNAHRINRGDFPLLKSEKEGDFFFIEENDAARVVEIIKNLCSSRLPAYYRVDPIDDIQVLAPMTRGEAGTRNLNEILQETLNPGEKCVFYGGVKYKLADKVMQVKNNYDKNVFNGDIGRITGINQEDRTVTIRFDQQEVEYDLTELDEVVLAYAATIHKSQGSEFKIVVAPLLTQHFMLLQRNLLYTCVTRAKKVLVLVGSKKALAIALKNNKVEKRNTLLARRL
ncbi:MAG: ATP-dependent RecD-like DNA helicase [Peptococcaceae bacterium]|jgi:exodeoxyribonuclease V alpha subunit|nr:ATP-dependent RecD-like DNA helicase [Peptococcaceae bacterium]MDH7524883.1 ATP-dependent RecD-like DNA helicase [Peptococcaceae bacterium]